MNLVNFMDSNCDLPLLPSNNQLWGEYENVRSTTPNWNKIINNFEQDVIINSVKTRNFKTYFFNIEEEFKFPDRIEVGSVKIDNVMKDTVQVMKYKNDVEDMIESKQLKLDVLNLDEQMYHDIINRNKKFKDRAKNSVQFYKHPDSNFTRGIWSEKPFNISPENALNLLKISVSTILAFTGFSETNVLPLQILTEVAENYILKMLKLLRINVEKEKIHGESGFCDVLDRTFHEIGFGSVKNIIPYYQENVLVLSKIHIKKFEKDISLCENALKRLKEQQLANDSNFSAMEEENMIIPELHVPSMLKSDLLSHSLESDLQMLQTLEAREMKNDDCVNSTHTIDVIVKNNESSNSLLESPKTKPGKRKRK